MTNPTCPRCPQHRPVLKAGFWCTPCSEAWLQRWGMLGYSQVDRYLPDEARYERENGGAVMAATHISTRTPCPLCQRRCLPRELSPDGICRDWRGCQERVGLATKQRIEARAAQSASGGGAVGEGRAG
jgi:hypothetical protein